MRSIPQLQTPNYSLTLLVSKTNQHQSLPKADLTKSSGPDSCEPKVLSVVNMSVYSLKNTCKDRKKIKDAVTVKRIKLLYKENVEVKKTLACVGLIRRNTLNFPTPPAEFRKRVSGTEPSCKALNRHGLMDGVRGQSGTIVYEQAESKALRKQRPQKENELGQNIFETKPLLGSSKSDALVNIKLRAYLNSIKEGRKFHELAEEVNKQDARKNLWVRIKRGNNSNLIRQLFKKRWWWSIEDDKEDRQKHTPNFIWSQLKQKSFYQSAPECAQSAQLHCHNHFAQNEYLGNKKALFYNMSHYYSQKGMDVFQRLPLTFHVTSLEDGAWAMFTDRYQQLKALGRNNIWIIKPGENSNRGRGITVHDSYEEIKAIVGAGETVVDPQDCHSKRRTHIIQSYIDRPLLYNRRKFDIRCYMLLVNINNSVKGYWYKEGYIRTSSFEFQLHDFNSFVHLTNDAVQNNSESYGKYEQGNKLSYNQFQRYLDSRHPGCGYDLEAQVVPKMKQVAADSLRAAVHLVTGGKPTSRVFEVFGLDFMIDREFQPWLIEVNTNPCIETSCLVLERVIPRMLDDALKLSVDLLFPPPEYWPSSRKHCLPCPDNKFQLIYDEKWQGGAHQVENPSLGVISEDGEFYEQKDSKL